MSRSRSRVHRHVNLKAVLVTVAVAVVLIGGGLLASGVFQSQIRGAVLTQAKELAEEGDKGLAMRHLERFLREHPDDAEVLGLYADMLGDAVLQGGDITRLDAAISANERVLRLDPEGAFDADGDARQDNRLDLAKLYIISSERYVAGAKQAKTGLADEAAVMNAKYPAAEQVLDDLIRRAEDVKVEPSEGEVPAWVGPEPRRLRGIAREGQAGDKQLDLLEKAADEYDAALALDPTDEQSAALLARLYRDRLKKPEDARRVLDRLLRDAPDSAEARLVVYRYYLDEDPERAAKALDKALELADDGDVKVILTAARQKLLDGDPAAVRELLARLPEKAAGTPEVELLRGQAAITEDDPSAAIERWQESLRTMRGTDERIVWVLATTLIDANRLEEARPLVFSRYPAVAGPGAAASVQLLQGLYLTAAGSYKDAVEKLEAAERNIQSAFKPQLLVALARARLGLGPDDRNLAQRDLEQAVALAPDNPQARLALAELLAAGDLEKAIAELRRGIAADPKSVPMHRALAELLQKQQAAVPAKLRSWLRFDEALAAARKELGDDPGIAAIEARRHLVEGRIESAIAVLEPATERHPESAQLWTNWADALLRAGRTEEALDILVRGSADAAAGDSAAFRIGRARLLTALGHGREATEVLTAGASTLPTDQRTAVLQALGQMQAARGQFAEAAAAYASWRRLQPGSPGPALAMLGLAIDTGDRQAAARALEDLKGRGDEPGLPYLLGTAEYLLRAGGDEPAEQRAAKAAKLLDQVLARSPELRGAYLLRGQAHLLLEDREGALKDFQAAWDRGETRAGAFLVDLMVQLGQFNELNNLEASPGVAFEADPARLAAEALLRHDEPERAATFVDRAVRGRNGPDVDAWRLAILDRLGRTGDVEQLLRRKAEASTEFEPWMSLIQYLAAHESRDEAESAVAQMEQQVDIEPPALLEAIVRQALGDSDAAARAYEQAIAARPDDERVLLLASRFDAANGRPDRAIERLRAGLKALPASRPLARMMALLLANRATDLSSWQAAWNALGPEPTADDDEAPQDRLARAIVLARHPDAERREEAVRRLEALVGDRPAGDTLTAAARETLARLLAQQGQADRAAEVAAVTAISGTDANAISLYAEALLAAEKPDEAARQIDRLAALGGSKQVVAALRARLAEARAGSGDKSEALERAVHEAKDPIEAAALFGRLAQLGGPAAEATARAGRDLAERFPASAWLPAHWFAGRAESEPTVELAARAVEAGDADEAIQAVRAILKVMTNDREDFTPALVDRAAGLAADVVAAHPELPEPQAALAMIRHVQGRRDPSARAEEVRIYRDLIAKDPDNVIYLNNLAWAVSEVEGDPEEAIGLIDRAIEQLGTTPPELLDTRGVILDRLGRDAEAVSVLAEVVRQRENDPVYFFHLARAQADAGQQEEARASIARALELGLTPEKIEPTELDDLDRLRSL